MKHIVLLRGLAREAAHWFEFPQQLQKYLGDEVQIHCIDFPGCGHYFAQPALGSITAMTDHARSELARLKINTPSDAIYLVGISMGGMIALDWAQRFPQEIEGAVLINSSTGSQPFWWRLRPGAWAGMICALFASMPTREAGVLNIVSNNPNVRVHYLPQWLQIQQQRPVSRATIIAMLRAAAGFRPQESCKVDGLVLASTSDRMVSVRASEAIATQFNWPIALHKSAGHDLPMDDPDWTAQQIANWLSKSASNRRKNAM